MMAHEGIVKQLLGQGIFEKYRINPWWEKAHSTFSFIYLVYLITFTFASFASRPANFVSDRSNLECSFSGMDFPSFFILVYLYVEIVSNFCCVQPSSRSMSVFAKAEDLYVQLDLPANELMSLAVRAALPQNSKKAEIKKLRKVTSYFWGHQPGHYEWVKLFVRELLISSVIAILSGIIAVNHRQLVKFSSQLKCTHPWLFSYMLFYFVTLFIHLIYRILILMFVIRFAWSCVQRLLCKKLFMKSARNTMMYFAKMRDASRPFDEKDFGAFVRYIFSEDAIKKMKENQEMVGTLVDPVFAELASKAIDDKKFIVQACANLDKLVEKREYRWIVALIEEGQLFVPKNIDMKTTDSEGRSFLFYALGKEQDSTSFNLCAAELILNLTPLEERIVCFAGKKMPAKKFVEQQYIKDPSYPERLKDHLIKLIDQSPGEDVLIEVAKQNSVQTENSDTAADENDVLVLVP